MEIKLIAFLRKKGDWKTVSSIVFFFKKFLQVLNLISSSSNEIISPTTKKSGKKGKEEVVQQEEEEEKEEKEEEEELIVEKEKSSAGRKKRESVSTSTDNTKKIKEVHFYGLLSTFFKTLTFFLTETTQVIDVMTFGIIVCGSNHLPTSKQLEQLHVNGKVFSCLFLLFKVGFSLIASLLTKLLLLMSGCPRNL